MIRHAGPRSVAVEGDHRATAATFRLDDILDVDLIEEHKGRTAVILDLLPGVSVIAARYRDPGEAGADFGRLRILLGQSAWPEEWERDPAPPPQGWLRRLLNATRTMASRAGYRWRTTTPC